MSSLQKKLALALGAATACFSSAAAAQQPPPVVDQRPPQSDTPDLPGAQRHPTYPEESGTYREGTYDTTPAQTTTTTSTTRTTSAEYNEMAGAEQERTIRPNRPMLITGAALFGAPYVAGVIVAAQSNLDADKRNYIPVVGPWLDLAQRPCNFGSGCSTTDNVGSAFLIASGAAQGLGVILAAASLAVPEQTTQKVEPPKASMTVTPVSFLGGAGVGALGTF